MLDILLSVETNIQYASKISPYYYLSVFRTVQEKDAQNDEGIATIDRSLDRVLNIASTMNEEVCTFDVVWCMNCNA